MNRCGRITLGLLLALFVGICPAALPADPSDGFLGIITGAPRSTAHEIGMDLKAMAGPYGLHLAVYDSSGCVENIHAVYQRPGNHLGLVQSDVLAFVAKVKSDPQLERIAEKIKWVYPLYDREIHILAKTDISTLGALNGRTIAVGSVENGSYLTSRLLLEIAGVVPGEIMPLDGDAALAALKAGTVDAMVVVDGMPVESLVLDVSPMDDLHLVPVSHPGVRAFYPASRIPSGTYPWQTEAVDTVSVRTILVTYDFHNHHCHAIGRLAALIRDRLDWLRMSGHPKWKQVNLDDDVREWERSACVDDYAPGQTADNEPVTDRRPNPVADAIEAVFQGSGRK